MKLLRKLFTKDFGHQEKAVSVITKTGVRFEYKPTPGKWVIKETSWFAFEVPKEVIVALAREIEKNG